MASDRLSQSELPLGVLTPNNKITLGKQVQISGVMCHTLSSFGILALTIIILNYKSISHFVVWKFKKNKNHIHFILLFSEAPADTFHSLVLLCEFGVSIQGYDK